MKLRIVRRAIGVIGLTVLAATSAAAQSQRLSVLQAEERRAPTANDIAVIRAGMRSVDTDTALLAIRAMGRLERPALVPDIAGALRFELPELRAEAAQAIAASFGRPGAPLPASTRAAIGSALSTLSSRLDVETVADVRGAICEAIGRLPYVDADQASQAEHALVSAARSAQTGTVADRLGAAKGLDAFGRISGERSPLDEQALDALRVLFRAPATDAEARVRRLSFDALMTAKAVDSDLVERAIGDPDVQVRMLAMSAAGKLDTSLSAAAVATAVKAGLADSAPLVRIEALHAESARETGSPAACDLALSASTDRDVHVVLAAIDALGPCGTSPAAVAFLEHTVTDLSEVATPRGWHRAAHALVALAGASPERAHALLPQFAASALWPLRLYAVKSAAVLNDRDVLQQMTRDADEAVAAEASRQLLRQTGDAASAPREAPAPSSARRKTQPSVLTAADLKRLIGARARITVRGIGSFELALLTMDAPETVIRFARLAESGYYDGLTIDRVLPNFLVQTRVPGGSGIEPDVDPFYPRDELSAWPHVRGALALSSDGVEPGDAQLFIDLVDNPRFDYQYTVFAQTINGLDVVDALLEGDVIERIEILP
jgi:peptidyl-prolyl cis-trans isomerase B (cyclophilin B)